MAYLLLFDFAVAQNLMLMLYQQIFDLYFDL
jgi:hypothetical protein